MYTFEIENKYGVPKEEFEKFLKEAGYPYREGMMGILLESDAEEAVKKFNDYKTKEHEYQELEKVRIEKEKVRIELEKRMKKQALASMLITSCCSIEGYKITKYSDFISGDGSIQVSRGYDGGFLSPTNTGERLMTSLSVIRKEAIEKLKEAAYNLGCNAVIGVDFDYITLDPQTANYTGGTTYLPYVFGVTANGNAVIIEKIDEE